MTDCVAVRSSRAAAKPARLVPVSSLANEKLWGFLPELVTRKVPLPLNPSGMVIASSPTEMVPSLFGFSVAVSPLTVISLIMPIFQWGSPLESVRKQIMP